MEMNLEQALNATLLQGINWWSRITNKMSEKGSTISLHKHDQKVMQWYKNNEIDK